MSWNSLKESTGWITRWRWSASVAVLVALTLSFAAVRAHSYEVTDRTAAAGLPGPAVERVIGTTQDSYSAVVAKVAPAVVTIRSERVARQEQQLPFLNDPRFRDFFGDRFDRQPQQRRQAGLGSGVIVRPDGYILTNHHVVDGAQDIDVELKDGRRFAAKLVGSDPPSDLAVLKIDAEKLHALPLGDTSKVQVGDIVLAIGNPLGVGQTVTMGIVSAKGRATGLGDGSFEDFLQTDAPINQGNSGGALVNTRGELVGINSQILSPSGGNIGIGFAIPANMAANVLEQLMANGEVRRGLLGVTVQSVTSEIASSLSLPTVEGALVSDVTPGAAADDAGVKRGDVILALNGAPIVDSNALRNQVAQTLPGTEVKLTIWRNRSQQELAARLQELPGAARATNEPRSNGEQTGGLGLTVQPLTPQLAERLRSKTSHGLVVNSVDPTAPAADAGFQPGDVIMEINGAPVRTVEELRAAMRQSGARPALVLVDRQGASLFLTPTFTAE